MPEVSEADLLIWVGDFNYRLADLSYADAINLINEKRYEILLEKDQLREDCWTTSPTPPNYIPSVNTLRVRA